MKKVTRYKFSYGDWYEGEGHTEYPIPCKGFHSKQGAEAEIEKLKYMGWEGFSDIEEYETFERVKIDVSNVNRVEIIGDGRKFTRYFEHGEFSLQDCGRTLKIFVE